jgi:hypothetical protein
LQPKQANAERGHNRADHKYNSDYDAIEYAGPAFCAEHQELFPRSERCGGLMAPPVTLSQPVTEIASVYAGCAKVTGVTGFFQFSATFIPPPRRVPAFLIVSGCDDDHIRG